MLNLEEYKIIREVIKRLEPQDQLTLNIIDKIESIISEGENNKQYLWSFFWNCGRQGVVEGLFKATKEEVDNAIGKKVYFGEILGKHSEIYGVIEEGDIKLESDEPLVVLNANESGYNPLEYLRYDCPICNDSVPVDEWDYEKNMCNFCADDQASK